MCFWRCIRTCFACPIGEAPDVLAAARDQQSLHRLCQELHRRRELPIEELQEPNIRRGLRDPLLEELLQSLVGELAPDARIVVTLRFQEDLDLSEIAAIVDMPVNTVKSHLRRSMDALRRKLTDKGHVYES